MNTDIYFGMGLCVLAVVAMALSQRFWRIGDRVLVAIWGAILAICFFGAIYFISRGGQG